MNKLSPKKLMQSKWTATTPINKEKHFLIVSVDINEDQSIEQCILQAIMSKRDIPIAWRELKDPQKWTQGWH